MSYAFSGNDGLKWNDEVVMYLASKFNSINPRIMVLSKSVFINATLAKFDNVSFIINAAYECLELSFSRVDADMMEPVIKGILEWEAFSKHSSRFCIRVDKETSRSILFDSGKKQSPDDFKRHFHNYEIEML